MFKVLILFTILIVSFRCKDLQHSNEVDSNSINKIVLKIDNVPSTLANVTRKNFLVEILTEIVVVKKYIVLCTEESASDLLGLATTEFGKVNECMRNQRNLTSDLVQKTTENFLEIKLSWTECIFQKKKNVVRCLLETMQNSLVALDKFKHNLLNYQSVTLQQTSETTSCMMNALRYFMNKSLHINMRICACVFSKIRQRTSDNSDLLSTNDLDY